VTPREPDAREPVAWSDPQLTGTRFDDVRWFERTDSTNRYLLECAAAGAPEGVVAVADEQTAGRGRLGRTWVAPAGSALLVSALLRPGLPAERTHLVTLAAGLAALDALDALSPVRAGLKWPNDVVVDDRKLAGILAEADGAGAVVVGMGCNVQPAALPGELREIATAIEVDRAQLLVAWLRAYDARLAALDAVVADAVTRSATLGRRVRVELSDFTSFEGTATDLTAEGFLVVDGRVVSAGDVVHLRHDGTAR
jgi:BirA family transcriptional regulator, biotin operon repressor / biotin---[acetyl-CoA-carboxylase] ligase